MVNEFLVRPKIFVEGFALICTYIDIVQLLDEGQSGLEIAFEIEHLLLVLEAHHGHLRGEGHVPEGFLV